jgi:homoserine kinase
VKLRVRVPASTSNLGPGFDCLGLALDLHLTIEVETTPAGLWIEATGAHAGGVPLDSDNLVHACLSRALRRAGRPVPGLRIAIHNDIPIARGLGSSAAATLAGLVAGEILAQDGAPPDATRVLAAAAEIEGHPDNVSPALLGGFVASALDGGRVQATCLHFPAGLSIVLVVPDAEVPTATARRLLSESVSRSDAVFNLGRLAMLLGALQSGDLGALRQATQDRLHQKWRLELVPGLGDGLEALASEPGCAAAVLSGSGPTLLGLFTDPPPGAGARAVEVLRRHGVQASVQRVHPDTQGLWWDARA